LQVEHPCPQCGGPVTLEESDRFLDCGFCRVRLYIFSKGSLRYFLPPKSRPIDKTLFVPYWRFRGMVFSIGASDIQHKVVDASFRARDARFLPPSLGFRAQALKMKFASPEIKAAFLAPQYALKGDLSKIHAVADYLGKPSGGVFHRAYLGETLSLIYAPVYIKNNKLFDGVLDKAMGTAGPEIETALSADREADRGWGLRFASALCPNCGWDLSGGRESLVLFCGHCKTAWQAQGADFKKVELGVLPSEGGGEVYLPFWCASVEIEGLQLESYADFAKAANLPKAIRPEWHEKPLLFWSPAFKSHPKIYLRLCSQLTTLQPEAEPEAAMPKATICPVTVDAQEAFESIKVTLAETLTSKKTLLPALDALPVKAKAATLALIPFHLRGSELIQNEFKLSFQKRSVHGLEI